MKHASLFSGIGGPEVAAALLGWENVFHCEINPFGRKVLEYWFPNSISYEDITKTSFKEWRGKIDVLTGGFPCQPFSYAGKRGGREDERYLWPEMLRAIDEIRPTWVVGENVAGLSTMVEGGVLTDVGCCATLFQEGDELHGYELEQSFTIERICGDLERLGYSVQPVLIPAAAVGAPHRRDRIFILAYDADPDSGDDLRVSREDAGKSTEERLQERNEVRKLRVSNQLRSTTCETTSDSDSRRLERTEEGRREGSGIDSLRRGRDGREVGPVANTNSKGREEPIKPARDENPKKNGARVDDRAERPRRSGNATYTEGITRGAVRRYDEPTQSEPWAGKSRRGSSENRAELLSFHDLLPGNRWRNFPTVSPIHRGNDGLPFNVDDLAIPFSKWRTESLKAYGNAIVPQVMYRIFEAIQACEA